MKVGQIEIKVTYQRWWFSEDQDLSTFELRRPPASQKVFVDLKLLSFQPNTISLIAFDKLPNGRRGRGKEKSKENSPSLASVLKRDCFRERLATGLVTCKCNRKWQSSTSSHWPPENGQTVLNEHCSLCGSLFWKSDLEIMFGWCLKVIFRSNAQKQYFERGCRPLSVGRTVPLQTPNFEVRRKIPKQTPKRGLQNGPLSLWTPFTSASCSVYTPFLWATNCDSWVVIHRKCGEFPKKKREPVRWPMSSCWGLAGEFVETLKSGSVCVKCTQCLTGSGGRRIVPIASLGFWHIY